MAEIDDTTSDFKLTPPPMSREEERKAKQKAYLKAYHASPEARARRIERDRARLAIPEVKAKIAAENKAYREVPEHYEKKLANERIRYSNPEVKSGIKAKRSTPEGNRKHRISNENARRRKKYGITPSQYSELLQSCGGRCSICKNPFDLNQKYAIHIDHCHETNVIRGLLCKCCNIGLGHFKDNPKLLRIAAQYLEQFKVEPQ